MKAISVNPDTVCIDGKDYPHIRLFANSAIGRDVMPLFIPDIKLKWRSRVCLAARISRLGKNISERFASRYVDALSMVNVLYPDPQDPQGKALIDSGGYAILDGAVTTGRWVTWSDSRGAEPLGSALPLSTAQTNGSVPTHCTAQINGVTYDLTDQARDIPRIVSLVSRLATLKTGDIIIIESTAVEVPLAINTYIQCALCGTDCLKLKVK